MKKTFVLCLLLGCALTLAACGQRAYPPAPAGKIQPSHHF